MKLNPPFLDQIYHSQSLELLAMGRYEAALEVCNKAIELNADYVEAHEAKALALSKLSHVAALTAYHDKIKESDINIIDTCYSKAKALEESDLKEEALIYYDEVITLSPDFVKAYFDKAAILKQLGKVERFIATIGL